MFGRSDPMLWVQNASLRKEVSELTGHVNQLTAELTKLKTLMHVCGVTKIFNELAPRSVYKSVFTSSYRAVVLQELIVRYKFTEVECSIECGVDRAVVVRIMNRIGADATGEGLLTIHGERIKMSGGG